MVEGAAFFLLCHDDVALDPDAVHKMVEESFRSNAGVVSPKFVNWDDPSILLHVGMSCDKTGAVVDRIVEGEVDHGQHDAVRDVFVAPGGCILVRADLFAELKGFDAGIVAMGEDLDLSWRSQVAGSRVVVAPEARVRHREAVAGGLEPLAVLGVDEGRHTDHHADAPATPRAARRAQVLHPSQPGACVAAGRPAGLRRGDRRSAGARSRPGARRRRCVEVERPPPDRDLRAPGRVGRAPPVPRRRGAPAAGARQRAPVALLQPSHAPGPRGRQCRRRLEGAGGAARRAAPRWRSSRAASGRPSARTPTSTSSTTWAGAPAGTASDARSVRSRSAPGASAPWPWSSRWR